MSHIILDFRLNYGRNETAQLLETLRRISEGDTLTIIADRRNAHELGRFYEILAHEGFDYRPRGGHNGELSIVARRRQQM